jgi:hypothetical protein
MNSLKAQLVTLAASPKTHEKVRLKVILTNHGTEDVSVLAWNTPLDRVLSDCFHVTVNGKKLAYDGPMVKRAAPTAQDYVTIKAGQSRAAEFPLSDAYDTSKPGNYRVKLRTDLADVVPKQTRLAGLMKAGDHVPASQPIPAATAFKMGQGDAGHQTLGAKARAVEKTATKKMPAVRSMVKKKSKSAPPLAPRTTGGTTARKAAAVKSHKDGYGLCVAALGSLANDAHYAEWFGTHTTARFNIVKANYSAVKRRLETIRFTYNLTGAGCDPGVFAYTYKGTSTIWFCDAYWSAPATGTDSKAGTVVHEHTHSDALTDDIQYGQTGCRTLARTQPDKAIHNADTHEYYAGG